MLQYFLTLIYQDWGGWKWCPVYNIKEQLQDNHSRVIQGLFQMKTLRYFNVKYIPMQSFVHPCRAYRRSNGIWKCYVVFLFLFCLLLCFFFSSCMTQKTIWCTCERSAHQTISQRLFFPCLEMHESWDSRVMSPNIFRSLVSKFYLLVLLQANSKYTGRIYKDVLHIERMLYQRICLFSVLVLNEKYY